MLAERIRAIQRVCFDSEPSEADLDTLGSRERWLVYRGLVRARLVRVIEAALPRTKAAVGKEPLQRMIDEWMSTGGPKTRYFRHVPNELVDFTIPILQDGERAWLADLARYEITAWTVRHAPRDPRPKAELRFDRRPLVGAAVRVLRLDHPVHSGPTPVDGYAPGPTILLVYRNTQHRAVHQKLNPLAADLVEAWQKTEETVAESVQRVAAAHGTEIGPAFIEKLSTLITNFIDQGILLGASAIGGQTPFLTG